MIGIPDSTHRRKRSLQEVGRRSSDKPDDSVLKKESVSPSPERDLSPNRGVTRLPHGNATECDQDILQQQLRKQFERVLLVLTEYSRTGDSEELHISRIALRRYRALLLFFRKALGPMKTDQVSEDLRFLLKLLGTARDQDVWIVQLEQMEKQFGLKYDENWRKFFHQQNDRCRVVHKKVRAKLRGDAFLPLFSRLSGMLATKEREIVFNHESDFKDYLAWRLYKSIIRSVKLPEPHLKLTESERHRFRRKIRLLRYWSEYARNYLGKKGTPFLNTFRTVSSILGEARDMTAALRKLAFISEPWAEEIKKQLLAKHKSTLQLACKEWKSFLRMRDRLEKLNQRAQKRIRK